MDNTEGALLTYFDTAVAGFDDRLRAVPPSLWASPTPCTEWNVRQLVNHMIQGSRIYVALLRGGSGAEFMVNLNSEVLDGDPLTAFREAVAQCRTAFRAEGALEEIVDYPF